MKGFDETMIAFEDWSLFIGILKDGGNVVELAETGLYYRKKSDSVFRKASSSNDRIFKDLLKLYNSHVDVYKRYFDNPIYLLQENEKMNRVINAYQQSLTYRVGLKIHKIKEYFVRK